MSASDPAITVVICTHNPRADYFAQCLDALRSQTLPATAWELIIVDNRSDELIGPGIDLGWHPAARIIREEVLGLTPARLRGIREANGALLVFVDDDNVLDPDYLAVAARLASERPFLGAWSGQCRPRFEAPPPAWTERYWGALCIRRFETESWSNQPRLADTMPAGAGLCVRREVAHRYRALHDGGCRRFQLDRTGTSLISGGDNDLAACACLLGLGVGLTPELKLDHLISKGRLEADYLARLIEGIAFSSVLLDAAWGRPTPPRGVLGRAADAVRAVRLRPPHDRMARAGYRGRDRAMRLLARSGD